ncbi:MAG TPA: hypothetical protein PLD59_02875 [Tepidisphaeraceae bacterium]|nr:hypothetical protein [Tepidisphaeraceae bacterium]
MATKSFITAALISWAASSALAQYPQIAPEIQAEASARRAAADAASDAAFEAAMPSIREWAAKGKPYIPGAAKPEHLPQAGIPAFPGAEGGGMFSFGGRGGKVFVVTNLNDSGPGSFREACEAGGPRIVVFNVAGIIKLKERVRIRAPYITIAGNTAPGDGVCIAGGNVSLDTHDIIIRHMRFRRGETWVGDRDDSIGGNPIGNVMIDHVSASWGLDENMSMYRHMYKPEDGSKELKLPTVNITIQNSIFSEGLNKYHHAFGATIGGVNNVFARNLFACNTGRNPSMGMGGDFNFVNNVVYNWRHRTMDGGDQSSRVNAINNYYKPGPATAVGAPISYRIIKGESRMPKGSTTREYGKFYVTGNIIEGNERVTNDNWAGGVQFADSEDTRGQSVSEYGKRYLEASKASEPFPMSPVTIVPAQQAYEQVLANSGATLPRRDAVDERVVNMVRSGTITKPVVAPDIVEQLSQVKYSEERVKDLVELIQLGMITDPSQVGGYPDYKGEPYEDSDGDGMTDAWELTHGLNPNDASDASQDCNGDGYTNIEKFIYNLDPARKIDWSNLDNNKPVSLKMAE